MKRPPCVINFEREKALGELAFDELYAKYNRLVYWAAFSVAREESAALDLSQEVFLKAWKNLRKLSAMDESQLKNWLYRVTVNAGVDNIRRLKREVLPEEMPDCADTDEDVLPEQAALTEELRGELMEAIDELPDQYRECVLLYYFSELDYSEIAEATGASLGTVKSRLFRAKAILKKALEDDGEEV